MLVLEHIHLKTKKKQLNIVTFIHNEHNHVTFEVLVGGTLKLCSSSFERALRFYKDA